MNLKGYGTVGAVAKQIADPTEFGFYFCASFSISRISKTQFCKMLRNLLEIHIQQEGTVYLDPNHFKKLYRRLRRQTLHEAVFNWRLENTKNEEVQDKQNTSNDSVSVND